MSHFEHLMSPWRHGPGGADRNMGSLVSESRHETAVTALCLGDLRMTEDTSETFDLESLDDHELTEQVHDDLYNGLKDEIVEATWIFLSAAGRPTKCSTMPTSMRIVGIDFRDGILFVPEALLAANAMKAGMEILRPLLAETGAEPIGKVVIGTVKGDIHDIGKNLVSTMPRAPVSRSSISASITRSRTFPRSRNTSPISRMSALLTTTMPYMKVVIDTLQQQGLRNKYIVLVGGAPLNEEFAKAIGADAYCRDAAVAVETAKSLIATRRAARH